jgi:hypothetical protein
MFEPQDHPNVIPYPGAPPTRPYDNAGWTLAFQMGVKFDRMLEPFTGPFEKITDWNVKPPAGRIVTPNATAMALDPVVNDAWRAVNRLLAAGEAVALAPGQNGVQLVVDLKPGTMARLQAIAKDVGVSFSGLAAKPAASHALRVPRIGLWDQYGGSMESGWTRWILEQFEFEFERVFPPQLDAGGLNATYDVLVFPNGGIPSSQGGGGRGGRGGAGPREADIPAEYRAQLGRVSAERTIPQLRQFVEAGGTIVAIGDAAENLAALFTLPIENHLVEAGGALPPSKFFVPGSVLSARVDTTHPAAAGMAARTDFFYDNSPVFRLKDGAAAAGLRPIAVFDSASPVRSGWGWGQQYLKDGVIAVEARVGKGRVLLFGPEILQRAQPHGTFKLLFNSLYLSVLD